MDPDMLSYCQDKISNIYDKYLNVEGQPNYEEAAKILKADMEYMQNQHFSRNDVAEKLRVSPQYVSRILSGKMNFTLKTISLIEERLGLELFCI